jgi:hypothetical protein
MTAPFGLANITPPLLATSCRSVKLYLRSALFSRFSRASAIRAALHGDDGVTVTLCIHTEDAPAASSLLPN